MFGIGLGEFIFIVILGIIFLGPSKLPEALVQIAKFFKSFRQNIEEAKQAIEDDMQLDDLTEHTQNYKIKMQDFQKELYDDELNYTINKEAKEVKTLFHNVQKTKSESNG